MELVYRTKPVIPPWRLWHADIFSAGQRETPEGNNGSLMIPGNRLRPMSLANSRAYIRSILSNGLQPACCGHALFPFSNTQSLSPAVGNRSWVPLDADYWDANRHWVFQPRPAVFRTSPRPPHFAAETWAVLPDGWETGYEWTSEEEE